ncbi:MAG: FKBP-type peptidyl-prolyl cis-trans isomerase [Cellvibrio sp.]
MSQDFSSIEGRVSYGIGRQMGQQLASNPFDGMNPNAVAQGILDALSNTANPFTDEQMQEAFAEINRRMQEKQAAEAQVLAKAGEDFLAENAKKEGVITTASGLQYEVITQGTGAIPSATSRVKTHYHGTLIDGTVFDSSVDRGQPIDFPVNGVIAGWTEALQLMPVGSKYRLYIPYQLAYGERGAGAAIKPYAALIFDVELIDIVG